MAAAIPYIMAGAQMYMGNQQANQANDLNQAQLGLSKEGVDLQRQQYNNRLLSGNNYWNEFMDTEAPTWDESLTQAKTQLDPLYQDTMKKALDSTNYQNKQRGFYGQLPGDLLAEQTAKDVQSSEQSAIGQLANQLYQQGQANKMAQIQTGLNAFGTYGNMDPITSLSGSSGSSGSSSNRDFLLQGLLDPADLSGKFGGSWLKKIF